MAVAYLPQANEALVTETLKFWESVLPGMGAPALLPGDASWLAAEA